MTHPLLAPVLGLVLWSFVMWTWLYVTRLPAIRRSGVPLDPRRPKGQLAASLPPEVQWKADNYNHLMEQPTLFYATALAFSMTGLATELDVLLAWAYVLLRISHSLLQATLNIIAVRFVLFSISSLVLLALVIRATRVVF